MLKPGFHKLHCHAAVKVPDLAIGAHSGFETCATPFNNGTSIDRQLKRLSENAMDSQRSEHNEHCCPRAHWDLQNDFTSTSRRRAFRTIGLPGYSTIRNEVRSTKRKRNENSAVSRRCIEHPRGATRYRIRKMDIRIEMRNTVNSKACRFTVAILGAFYRVFEPIRMKTSDFSRRQPGFAVEMLSASPTIGVGLLPKEGNQQVRVMDCC